MTSMDDPRLDAVRVELEARPEIVLAYVFGSVARGTAARGSDIDIAVALTQPPSDALAYRARLAEELTRAAGSTRVEVVLLQEAPPALAGRIVREGRLLVCRDETRRVRIEVDALRREFDTEPLRRALDHAQSAAIRAEETRG